MPDTDRLAARLDAVERALTGGERDLADLPDAATTGDRLDELDDRIGEVETDLAELEAAVRALRGYVGNVDAVNEAVERRADAALAVARGSETEPEAGSAGDGPNQEGVAPADPDEQAAVPDPEQSASPDESSGPAGPEPDFGDDGVHRADSSPPDVSDGTGPGGPGRGADDSDCRDACAPAAGPVRTAGDFDERGDVRESTERRRSDDSGDRPEASATGSRRGSRSDATGEEWLDRHDEGTGACPTCGHEQPGERESSDGSLLDALREVL